MAFFIIILALGGACLGIYLGLLIGGLVLRFVASLVGVEGITLGNAILTSFLSGIAGAVVTVPIRLAGWPEPFSSGSLGFLSKAPSSGRDSSPAS